MRIALALGLCLVALTAVPAARGDAKAEDYRSTMNENVVTIMAGSPDGTDLGIAYDIAQVVDDGNNLRVLPIVGNGAAQSVKDVMFLKGVDMGITQANILKYFAHTGELGPNFIDRIVYVAKLFTEEVHIIARSDVTDIKQLNGQIVKLGALVAAPTLPGAWSSTRSASTCRSCTSAIPMQSSNSRPVKSRLLSSWQASPRRHWPI